MNSLTQTEMKKVIEDRVDYWVFKMSNGFLASNMDHLKEFHASALEDVQMAKKLGVISDDEGDDMLEQIQGAYEYRFHENQR